MIDRNLKILFLEDSREDAELEERELRAGGLQFESLCVARREEFLAALRDFQPDLVILDYKLPGMDGMEALQLVRESRPGAPAIFVSGSIGEEKAIECLKAGATDYVVKQRLAGLVFTVTRALKETEQQRALRSLEDQLRQAQKMDAIGRLAGGIAHDFNNILVGILGFSELGLRNLKPGEPLYEYFAEIRRAGQRAAALTDQLLSFSRKQVMETAVIEVHSIVVDACHMLERTIGRNYELNVQADGDAGRIRANRGQIEQVLLNLVLNSRDAMPQGGRISIRVFNHETGGPAPDAGSYTALSVIDHGCGIDSRVREHLFEPFFTTKERGKGTGLGLSTVYGIVKQSGGHVDVASEPGRGATVTVYLPRVFEEAPPPVVAPQPEPNPSRGGETILVVDDEEMVRNFMSMVLSGAGYNVLTASNGKEALGLSASRSDCIHATVSDLVMPGMNGSEFARQFKAQRPDARVLLVSGYPDEMAEQSGVKVSFPFLKKPFRGDDLLRRVREILDRPGERVGAEIPARGQAV
ncbi:MAG: response regulator [Planctomycetes bacterium]|nr:response regulator [Planctomycetota bacterium]